jgi:hypothetical protein
MSRRPDDPRDYPETPRQPVDREDLHGRHRDQHPASWTPSASLTLPRCDERQSVRCNGRSYRLRGSETELLATIGAFRIVPETALQGDTSVRTNDLRSLSEQGLIERRTIVINNQAEAVIVLNAAGRALLEEHRIKESAAPTQEYYDGFVKPRELAHDAQLYHLFQTEASRLEAEGARVTKVVIDYELKRDYHTFVSRQENARPDIAATNARRLFAEQNDLPFVSGRIQFPDVRIEYESEDGRECHRDLELATEHYSRSQIGGKQRAGFRVYRAVGAGSSSGRGTPGDPHHLEWLR